MSARLFWPVLLVLTGGSVARSADTKVVVPGEPPLTRDVVDDYARFLEWRLGSALAPAGGPERLSQMIVGDWTSGDSKRRQAILAGARWWRDEQSKLSKEDRERLAGRITLAPQEIERLRQSSEAQAIQRLILQQTYDARLLQILAINRIAAGGHDLNMRIIDSMRPSGRYEYNPATGRYDRYVPYR